MDFPCSGDRRTGPPVLPVPEKEDRERIGGENISACWEKKRMRDRKAARSLRCCVHSHSRHRPKGERSGRFMRNLISISSWNWMFGKNP